MNAARLKEVMEKTGKTSIDVASATKIHLTTVSRYLKGKPVHRSTEAAFERYIEDLEKQESPPPRVA